MCGIAGTSGSGNQVPRLLRALGRLEYRGYDTCGVALLERGRIRGERTLKRVADLEHRENSLGLAGGTRIAYTRCATRGAPWEINAHPTMSGETIAVVHNGVIENLDALRTELRNHGFVFCIQTDTDVIAPLIQSQYQDDLFRATLRALARRRDAYAITVLCACESNQMVAARSGSPLVIRTVRPHCNSQRYLSDGAR
jgi:glucosamine--fructose-6-phosphate aminotransferase (isomerizing)